MSAAKILVVDDVAMFIEIAKGILKLSPVRVLTARDGVEALTVVRNERPALVFMDLHMPNMNGAECCAAIKGDPALRSIPVVMMTSAGKDDDRELCFQAGCDDFLTKPLDRVLFLEKAREYIRDVDRRETRVPFSAKLKFRVHGVTLSGECVDIGENGVYVAADYAIDLGSVLEMTFTLPDRKQTVIQARGKVAWLNGRKARSKPALPEGFGVEFVDLPVEALTAIRFFVDREAAKIE